MSLFITFLFDVIAREQTTKDYKGNSNAYMPHSQVHVERLQCNDAKGDGDIAGVEAMAYDLQYK